MAGIVSFGAYVPTWRLARELIAREWGVPAGPGERAVAGHDEDSLTLAAAAALLALPGEAALDGVFFASTTPPYREKQSAATLAAVLDAAPGTRTADFTDSTRSATTALMLASELAAGGAGSRFLVAAGDCRTGEPDSWTEGGFGDAGGAVVVGPGAGLAEIVARCTIADEIHGTWRTETQAYPQSFPGAFEAKLGYGRLLPAAVAGVLKQAGLAAADVACAVLPGTSPRAVRGLARTLGFDPARVQDVLWETVGDTGAAQPLLLLAAALERAKPGDRVLLAGYGDGADAILLRVTEDISAYRPLRGVSAQIEVKRNLPSWGRYARFRKLLAKPGPKDIHSSAVVLHRDRKQILPLYGGRCPSCGVVQFPVHRACIECGDAGTLAPVRLARRGAVFTFTQDHVGESPDSPVSHAVVDLDGGGRLFVQVTDCEPERVAIGLPVELTLRKIHEGGGMNNYFWKAKPLG